MSRLISFRLLALSLVASFAILVMPHGALADAPFTEDVGFTDPGATICGVSTTIEVVGTQTIHIQQLLVDEGSGSIWFEGNVKAKYTVYYTSNVNGYQLTSTVNSTTNDISYEQLGDSVFAFTYAINGIPLWLRDGHKTLVKDSGSAVFTDVWDLHDLNNPDDNEFVSGELVSLAGPHPALDSSAFCDAYVPLMGA